MPRKLSSPAQAKRSELAAHIRARGERAHNIWVIRPPFEDEDIYLSSDGAMELFYYVEGDSRFREISYTPLRTKVDKTQSHEDLRFAEVVTDSGLRWTVYLKRGSSSVEDAGHIRVDLATLSANEMRTQNWRRIVPCIRRVRFHAIASLELGVETVLRDGEQLSLRQVCAALGKPADPLIVGAIATLIRRRTLRCDCDTRPWSWNTLISVGVS